MTTKMKEGIPTKEKRGTSPSHPPNKDIAQRGKSPRPSISKQAPPAKRSDSASPSGRNVPNYLKGTARSGPESSSLDHGKKHSPNETLKPTISRRKSLDKPLPPSHVPKTRASTITKETKKQPSSARATGASAKPLSGRLSKARSFSEEKASSRNIVKKVENEARGLSTKDAVTETVDIINHVHDIAPKKENALQITPQTESLVEKNEDLDASISQIDPKDNGDIKKEVIVMEDNNSHIDTDSEIEVEEVKIDESSIASKDKNESFDSIEDIPEENLNENEIHNEEQGELEPHISASMEESSPLNEVEADASEEKEVEEVPSTKEELKETEVEGKGEGGSDDVETKALETSLKKDEEKKEKQGGVISAAMKQQVVAHGKRDAVVSNDAIEETATKLREQRVNRVKALAGAFESVMS